MKSMIAAILFALALSANAGMVYADDDGHDGYQQHESKDHGDKDRYEQRDREHADRHEHGDRQHADRHEHGDRQRGERHAAERGVGHAGAGAESGKRMMPDWWPF